jgi:peptide/nickel transport system substrate-binding protein
MNRKRLALLALSLALLAALALPLVAQEWVEGSGPGEGGVIFLSLGPSDPATFNPIIGADATSSGIYDWLYPSIFTINWQTGLSEPNQPHGLATGWEFDETGTVVTITLRQDAFWSDGTQITAADYLWAAEAVRSGVTSSPRTGAFETLADGTPAGGKIVSIEAPDDFTVVVTLSEADCIAFEDINDIAVVPSHIFEELYGSDYALMDESPRDIPNVTFGPFGDLEFEAGVRVSLLADQGYPDTFLGYVSPSEQTNLIIPDNDIAVERFIAGELAVQAIPGRRQSEFKDNPDFQIYEFTRNGYVFVAMNNADPANPQPGIDADGNPIPQTPHPVLGDRLVRQAITRAVPVQDLIDGILDGNAVPVATHTIPTSWAHNPDLQYEYDLDAARALLTEAGWIDHDNDESTPRICQGCLYAREVDPDFEGSPLQLRFRQPSGDPQNELWAALFRESLAEIGIDLDAQEVDWSSVFLPELVGQTFDMAVLAWSLGLPIDPDVSWVFYPEVDTPGSGFNFVSYYNPELVELNDAARVVDGCDVQERRGLYQDIQQILFDDAPYFFLYVNNNLTAAQLDLVNWNPTPYSRSYSMDAWVLGVSPMR